MITRKASVEIVKQDNSIEGIYEIIEKAGRLCYASDIIEGKAKDFFDRMVRLGHLGVIEFGTVYLRIPASLRTIGVMVDKYIRNPHSIVCSPYGYDDIYITTNMRVLVENDWLDDLSFYSGYLEGAHEERIVALFHTDRITGESFLRHRTLDGMPIEFSTLPFIDPEKFSFCRQSTRYCNYSKAKFGNQITFVEPHCYNGDANMIKIWKKAAIMSEESYFEAIKNGMNPEQARYLLMFSIYSPLMMCGTKSDWDKFFKLRCNEHAHPDARLLANELKSMIYEKD